jgi:hypothetical protein
MVLPSVRQNRSKVTNAEKHGALGSGTNFHDLVVHSSSSVCSWHFPDLLRCRRHVCFSNWPCWVKRFQTVHFIGLNVSHGVSLLFGIGTYGPSIMGFEEEAEQSFGRPCCPIRTAGPSRHTNSPDPSSREGHRSTAWRNPLSLLPCRSMRCGPHAVASCRVHWNSVPSTQMRCMTTANRRASATIAFFIPRVLAIFIAQALSQDHFVVRTSTIWAAS